MLCVLHDRQPKRPTGGVVHSAPRWTGWSPGARRGRLGRRPVSKVPPGAPPPRNGGLPFRKRSYRLSGCPGSSFRVNCARFGRSAIAHSSRPAGQVREKPRSASAPASRAADFVPNSAGPAKTAPVNESRSPPKTVLRKSARSSNVALVKSASVPSRGDRRHQRQPGSHSRIVLVRSTRVSVPTRVIRPAGCCLGRVRLCPERGSRHTREQPLSSRYEDVSRHA